MLSTVETVLLVSGRAVFTGPREVEVSGGPDRLRITADAVCIDTGSLPVVPDIPGAHIGGRVYDSAGIQQADPLPARTVVIGGGYVGLELASMLARFGSAVTVLARGPRLLAREDADVSEVAVEAIEDAGVRFVTGASAVRIEHRDDSAVVVYRASDEDGEPVELELEAEAVLLATGRRPSTPGLGLEAAGIATDDAGWIKVDDKRLSSAERVWAVGDVNGGPQFTFVSLDDSRIVASQLLGDGSRTASDRVALPSVLFIAPPLARVGLTERQAHEQGLRVRVATKRVADIAAMPKPKIDGDPRGIVKVVVDADTDLVVGAALMHVDAQEVVNLVAMAMRHGITASQLRDAIYTHPSSTEALNEVLAGLAPADGS